MATFIAGAIARRNGPIFAKQARVVNYPLLVIHHRLSVALFVGVEWCSINPTIFDLILHHTYELATRY